MAIMTVLHSLSCSYRPLELDESTSELIGPKARWLTATTIARVRITSQNALTFERGWWRTGVCAYHQHLSVLDVVDGVTIGEDVVSDKPLELGSYYLVAILDTGEPAPASAYHPSITEEAHNYAVCRERFPHLVLGWAEILEVDGQERVPLSSNLTLDELRDAAINETVELGTLVAAGLRIREERAAQAEE